MRYATKIEHTFVFVGMSIHVQALHTRIYNECQQWLHNGSPNTCALRRAGWIGGWLASWLAGWLAGWLTDWLAWLKAGELANKIRVTDNQPLDSCHS